MIYGRTQRDAFLEGEADAWFERNPLDEDVAPRAHDLRLAEHLNGLESVLEVGCADGRRLARLAELVPSLRRLSGIDPSRSAVESGRARWPTLTLDVGTADEILYSEPFDAVVLGFFMYLCDRALLPRIVAETDRVLADGGVLAIIDFDPPGPRTRRYRHLEGITSYKLDYSSLFTAYPSYSLVDKLSFSQRSDSWTTIEGDRVALCILRKHLVGGYSSEDDDFGPATRSST